MATFTGTANADTITPTTRSAGVTVVGTPANLSGNDLLIGLGGDDLLDGGVGNDTLEGGVGGINGDRLFGNVGDDFLAVVPTGLGTRIDGGIGTDTLYQSPTASAGNPLGLVDYTRATIVSVERLWTISGTAKLTTAQLNAFTTLGTATATQVQIALADSVQAVDLTGNIALGVSLLQIYGSGSGGSASLRVDPLYTGRLQYNGDTVFATRETIVGGNGSNLLNGGAGDDFLVGGRGNDVFDGGDGNDTVSFAAATSGVVVDLSLFASVGAGSDQIFSVENLIGSAFGDDLYGDAKANRLSAGGGVDYLQARGGRDVLDGGDGNDQITLGPSNLAAPASIAGGLGSDTLVTAGNDLRATAISGVETLVMRGFAPVLLTSAQAMGFSQISGVEGVLLQLGDAARPVDLTGRLVGAFPPPSGIQIIGSSGNDQISVGANYGFAVTLRGGFQTGTAEPVGTGNDLLRGGAGMDRILGFDGNDQLAGNDGSDILGGGLGDDVLAGGPGDDRLFGDSGIDTASYIDATSEVAVSTATSFPQNTVGGGIDTLYSIENLFGSAYGDVLVGDASVNRLTGWTGDDVLDSRSLGRDILDAGDGNDLLFIGAGGQLILSGGAGGGDQIVSDGADLRVSSISGVEYLYTNLRTVLSTAQANAFTAFNGAPGLQLEFGDALAPVDLTNRISTLVQSVVLYGSAGNDRLSVGAAYGKSVTLEGVLTRGGTPIGVSGDDILSGGAAGDLIRGWDGSDRLFGNGGADVLQGGAGIDGLYGGAGADSLYGDAGNDVLDGGADGDVLWGGLGADRFYYAGPAAAGTRPDRIADFLFAQGDQVQIGNGVTAIDDAVWRVSPFVTAGYLQNLSGGAWITVAVIDGAAGLNLSQVVLNPVV